jgi:hypothetical protein
MPTLIADKYAAWEAEAEERFNRLKANEEELNRIFIDTYGLQDELTPEVADKDVTVRKADLQREIRSLISYAVGCMFGRYSLDEDGLVFAGGEWDASRYKTFRPDGNNIIPILDAEWFEDDAVSQLRHWLKVVYGGEVLDENLRFIEAALGKDVRSYLVRDFYNDHIKVYQKRPIYWLLSSPKKSFNALVYLHRYNENTISELLSKYLRPFKDKLNMRIHTLQGSGSAKDAVEADKLSATVKELEDWERDVIYPLANEHIRIDLDDGVKVNYNKFPNALRKVAGLSEW